MLASPPILGACLAAFAFAAPAQILRVDGDGAVQLQEPRASLHAGAVERAVHRAVVDALPPMWRVESIRIDAQSPAASADGYGMNADGEYVAPQLVREGLRAQVQFLAPPSAGAQWVSVLCRDRRNTVQAMRAIVTLAQGHDRAASSTASVHRGNDVTVIVRSGNITVQARGSVQSDAAYGESVTVLVENATRTLQAVVKGSKEVEVTL